MTPKTVAASGNATLQFGGEPRQISIVNEDASNDMNVKINGDPVGFTVSASERRGWRFNKGIYPVIITATGGWEVTVL